MKTDFFSLGLIGYPLESSFSPRMHNAALRALGLAGEYRLFPVPPLPDGASQLEELLGELRHGELHGLNVTIPHKLSVLPLLDKLSPEAQAIGAVNTILRQGDMLIGDNTDAAGFMTDLQRVLPRPLSWPTEDPVERKDIALVLGAGGSTRAVVYTLANSGWRVIVAARRLEMARSLCDQLAHYIQTSPLPELQAVLLTETTFIAHSTHPVPISEATLIVNTTPVGMYPHTEASPWPKGVPLPVRAIVYDLIYNPPETALMRSARQVGLHAENGLGMLLEQAILSFEAWTGQKAPRAAMRDALMNKT